MQKQGKAIIHDMFIFHVILIVCFYVNWSWSCSPKTIAVKDLSIKFGQSAESLYIIG